MADELDLLEGLEDLDIPLDSGSASAPEGQGQFLGPYQLIREIGVGGVAKVYRARHIHPGYADKTFAVKILHDSLSNDPQVVDLFRGEAFVLSMLKHPNIVETFEAGEQDNRLFIAMEYIAGRDLDNLVVRCQQMKLPFPESLAVHVVGDVLKGLVYAHDLCDADGNRLNLVHRDINPANVFLSFDGRVKLGDFGVASLAAGKVEKDRELAGKAGYFAPEQLEGAPVDQRADVFAVGVMMFEVFCGQRLFQADNVDALLKLNRKAKIPRPRKINPAIPPAVEEVILKALQKKPADRFQSAKEMLTQLLVSLPPATPMTIGLAGVIRTAFVSEHIQEMQLNEGLAGGSHARGSGQLIHVVSQDPKAQGAFRELMTSRGYRAEIFGDLASALSADAQQGPSAMLVDLDLPGLVASIPTEPPKVAVVGFTGGWNELALSAASSMGAVDLLFKPYNIERVLSAVRAAVTGVAKVAEASSLAPRTSVGASPKVLLLSQDLELLRRLEAGFEKRDYLVETAATPQEAVERALHASYHGVVFDSVQASPADRFFATEFRGQAGMGMVPILYLTVDENDPVFASVEADRAAVRRRDDPPAVSVETLNRLRGDSRLGRTFLRYDSDFPVELRYGGRVFSGTVVDVSRGGVMLTCDQQMPPVGTEVGLNLRLPGQTTPVQARGHVARVEVPRPGSPTAKVGIEFEQFSGAGEASFIKYLASQDHSGQRSARTTLI